MKNKTVSYIQETEWTKPNLERWKIKHGPKYKCKQKESSDHNKVEFRPENSQRDRQRGDREAGGGGGAAGRWGISNLKTESTLSFQAPQKHSQKFTS